MISLSIYSSALLIASGLKAVDIQISMQLGELYSKKLFAFIAKNYVVADFKCVINGLSKQLILVTSDETVTIELLSDSMSNQSIVKVINSVQTFIQTWSTYDEFVVALAKIDVNLHENSTAK